VEIVKFPVVSGQLYVALTETARAMKTKSETMTKINLWLLVLFLIQSPILRQIFISSGVFKFNIFVKSPKIRKFALSDKFP